MTGANIVFKVAYQNERPDVNMIPSDCPLSLKKLMIACWNKDPISRPTFSQIIDYLSVEQMKIIN